MTQSKYGQSVKIKNLPKSIRDQFVSSELSGSVKGAIESLLTVPGNVEPDNAELRRCLGEGLVLLSKSTETKGKVLSAFVDTGLLALIKKIADDLGVTLSASMSAIILNRLNGETVASFLEAEAEK